MLAHDVAAANGGKADVAALARPGDAVAPAVAHVGQFNAAPRCGSLSQHQGGARWRVNLVTVMRLDHFDIKIFVQRGSDLFRQLHQQVDPKAHVARAYDDSMMRGAVDSGDVVIRQASRADHMHRPRLRREASKSDRGGGGGKVDNGLRFCKGRDRIVRDSHAQRSAAHRRADILSDPSMAFAFKRGDQMAGVRLRDSLHQHLPHAARSPRNHDSRCACHRCAHHARPLRKFPPSHNAPNALGKGLLGIVVLQRYMQAMAKTSSSGGGAPNQRQLRLGELIRRRLSELLQRGEIHDPELSRMMITVGEVRCSPDLSVATAFILPLGGDKKEEALLALRKSRHEIRREVAKVLSIKFAPEIRFEIDDTFDRMDATRALFERADVKADLAAPGAPEGESTEADKDNDA